MVVSFICQKLVTFSHPSFYRASFGTSYEFSGVTIGRNVEVRGDYEAEVMIFLQLLLGRRTSAG